MTVTSIEDAEPAERYFVDVTRRVFDGYFEGLGAHHSQRSRHDAVRYEADSWFAEVIYLPKDGPTYSSRVMIGCREDLFADPRRNRVDIMHTVPEGAEERSYNLTWRYRNRRELERTLKSVRDKIVDIHSKPYLADSNRLRCLLTERERAVEDEWADEIDRHNTAVFREKAEKALAAKDYAAAVHFYEQIPGRLQTDSDQARAKYARALMP
jgi:hypothetical protein